MSQSALAFYDSAEAATQYAIQASGKSYKAVGSALWPDKSVEAAATALRNALNPNRDERLTTDQHIFIANFCSRFDWLYYAAFRCSHSRPKIETPAEQTAEAIQSLFSRVDEFMPVLNQVLALRDRLKI